MKYLCTGGTGFIGSHVVERLLDDGHEVVVISNYYTGKEDNLKDHVNLTVIRGSILDSDIDEAFEGIDVVIHLAALTRPRESFMDPIRTSEVNILGTQKVIENCHIFDVKRFIFISSATVYGFRNTFPTSEDEELRPVSPYGLTKKIGEDITRFFCELYDIEYNIIRPFNVYGKRQDPAGEYGAAVPKFIDTLKRGLEKPFITGDGKQFRDFIYISDLVDLIIEVSRSDVTGEVFNGGSGIPMTINEIYEKISEIMGKSITPDRREEVREPETHADISKAKGLLDWKPKVSLEEGFRNLI